MNVVSLYDESGNMLRPWARAGFTCWCVDIVNDNRSEQVGTLGGVIHYIKANVLDDDTKANVVALNPVFVSSFPPCTDLTIAGTSSWYAKGLKNPNFQGEAMRLVYIADEIIRACDCPGLIENPRGKISTIWRKPDFKFDPCEFGGYLPIDDVHPRWPQYLPPRDAYPKFTCLWVPTVTGAKGKFWFPLKKTVFMETLEYPGWRKLGGKSLRTKQIRSETPRGFAEAVFQFNSKR